MQKSLSLFTTLTWLAMAGSATAFGTISTLGQNREHEKITRAALSCRLAPGLINCFEPQSIGELAGGSGTFGAVGAPDRPGRGLISDPKAHCDDGDVVPVAGYPAPKLRDALFLCKRGMLINMLSAKVSARDLLNPDRRSINDAEIPTWFSCNYDGAPGRAKCEVLEFLGLTLHASQDFYSHTNWSDEVSSGTPGSVTNPIALGNVGRAPWLDLRSGNRTPPPTDLFSGCFVSLPEWVYCRDGPPGHPRVRHSVLNKDKGEITLATGSVTIRGGSTPRAAGNSNFERAVNAAIQDTRDKWEHLQEMLIHTYGPVEAALMICAITHDNPVRSCRVDTQEVESQVRFHNPTGYGMMMMVIGLLAFLGLQRLRGRRLFHLF